MRIKSLTSGEAADCPSAGLYWEITGFTGPLREIDRDLRTLLGS